MTEEQILKMVNGDLGCPGGLDVQVIKEGPHEVEIFGIEKA